MREGDLANAMITAMSLVQIGPKWIPRPIMRFFANIMIRSQKKSTDEVKRDGNTSVAELAPVLRYDFAIVEEVIGEPKRFEGVGEGMEVLLLDGGNSPGFVRVVMGVLERVVMGARRVTIEGVGHEVLCNKDFRGRPEKAVSAIRDFFG